MSESTEIHKTKVLEMFGINFAEKRIRFLINKSDLKEYNQDKVWVVVPISEIKEIGAELSNTRT